MTYDYRQLSAVYRSALRPARRILFGRFLLHALIKNKNAIHRPFSRHTSRIGFHLRN